MATPINEQLDREFCVLRDDLVPKLRPDIAAWDRETMIANLWGIVHKNADGDKNPFRKFCRKHLHLASDTYREISKWMRGEMTLPAEMIKRILMTINDIKEGKLDALDAEPIQRHAHPRRVKESIITNAPVEEVHERSEAGQSIVGHATTILNSLSMHMTQMGVTPADAYDGDRMQIRDALEKISKSVGINVQFTDNYEMSGQPLTSDDLSEMGLSSTTKRRRRHA